MRPNEREVAGLTCSAVMAALSDMVDGELPAGLAAQIEAHVAGCDWCASFGANFAALIQGMRRQLSAPEPVPADVLDRLRVTLRRS